MNKKRLKKYLFKSSFKLYLLYLLSTIMIISMYDNSDWQSVLVRSITIGILSLIIFCLNIEIIAFYKRPKYKSRGFKNTEKRIFITGLLGTMVLFSIHYFISIYLSGRGMNMHLPDNMIHSGGWKIALILFYISVVEYTVIYLIQNFTLSQHEKSQFELELLQLKNSNAETANQLLQQQIKPHFLFNALATLKSLIKRKPDIAEAYLIQLSDFLRASFVNSSAKSGLTSVSKELEICSNYMAMQKVRFGDAINYSVDEKVRKLGEEKQLPTFSLQPLLENAIKHNVVTNLKPLHIAIALDKDYIRVSNNLQSKTAIKESTQKGLHNLRERYQIISNDDIKVEKTKDRFSISIKIL